jgi:hypothetical protein
MRLFLPFLFAALLAPALGEKISYPPSRRSDTTDQLHGTTVPDPYRWLEDLNSAETSAWIKAQNEISQSYLEATPGRDTLEKHLTQLWNVERYGIPFREGGRYFFTKNDGLQNQSVLYTTDSLDTEPKVLLDPNTLSSDGTVALSSYEVSPDGRYLAYSTSKSGSDWIDWHIREIASGKDLPDRLLWSKFSGASWSKDSKGFYYGRFPTPEKGQEMTATNLHKKIYYHRLGTSQKADQLIYERPQHPKEGLYAWVSEDGRYLLIQVSRGTDTRNGLFYRDLTLPDSPVVELLPEFDASYEFISNLGTTFLIQTDLEAPKQRVVAIDLTRPERANWQTLIPESPETLRSVSHVGGILIANYLKDARTEIRRFQTNGSPLPSVKLPGLGTASGFGGKAGEKETFYTFTHSPAPAQSTATTPKPTPPPSSSNQPPGSTPPITDRNRSLRPRRTAPRCPCSLFTEKVSPATARIPPSSTLTEASTSPCARPTLPPPSPGSTSGESTSWPTCGAAENTAKNGTAAECGSKNKMSSMTSSPALNISLRKTTPLPRSSPFPEAPTAACSWGPAWFSDPTSTEPASPQLE